MNAAITTAHIIGVCFVGAVIYAAIGALLIRVLLP